MRKMRVTMDEKVEEGAQVLRAGALWHFASFKLQSETVDTSAPDTKQALARFFIRSDGKERAGGGKGSKKGSRDGLAQRWKRATLSLVVRRRGLRCL